MLGVKIGNIGEKPYKNSYINSEQNKNNVKVPQFFSKINVQNVDDVGLTNSVTKKYLADVIIDYPPSVSSVVNNNPVVGKPKDEMTLDEYKQWVMNEISHFSVSGWARSTFSAGAIVIKEEAFVSMKNDPDYENYVLNRVRSAYSVKGLPVGSNNVGYDVIGATPEECYGYAGPAVGNNSIKNANDGETWWEKRRKKIEEVHDKQTEKNRLEYLARQKQIEQEFRSQIYASQQRMLNLFKKPNVINSSIAIESQIAVAASAYEKNVKVQSDEDI